MDPEKFIELQKQMRENNQEVADFLSGFNSWKEQVETKDARLRTECNKDRTLPAVRNSLYKKHRKKCKNDVKTKPTVQQRIRSSDYEAWGKFDVERALAEIDKSESENEKNGNISSEETDEELENHRRLELAKNARELGNLRFKEGKFQEAIEHYTTTVRLTPEDPVPYTNRALAFLKLERYASAESDCSAALRLDKKCLKALFRRALARKALSKKNEAVEDLKELLSIDEKNKAAIAELISLTGQPYSSTDKVDNSISQVPLLPKVSLRGSRKLRRIPIVEVGGADSKVRETVHQITKPNDSTTTTIHSSNMGTISASIKTPVATPLNQETNQSIVNNRDTKELKKIESTQPMGLHHSKSGLTVPSNWYQLEKDLRELSGNERTVLSDAAVNYLCRLEPNDYLRIISSNLEPSFLSQLLRALHTTDQLSTEDIASRLSALAHLPRFDVAWCLTDDYERGLFNRLLTQIEASSTVPAAMKERLRTVYT